MSLRALILKELERGPATRYELASRLSAGPRYLENALVSMKGEKQIRVIGKRAGINGRSTNLYALVEYQPQPAPEKAPVVDSEPIAGGAYGFATSRTYPQYVYPGKGSRRGL